MGQSITTKNAVEKWYIKLNRVKNSSKDGSRTSRDTLEGTKI
jgi:hypothetical protein